MSLKKTPRACLFVLAVIGPTFPGFFLVLNEQAPAGSMPAVSGYLVWQVLRRRMVHSLVINSTRGSMQVVVAEGAPHYGGHQMARELAQAGIVTTAICDSATFAMMARVNKVGPPRLPGPLASVPVFGA